MSQVSAVLRRTEHGYTFWCPGCEEMHHVRTDHPGGYNWSFDGNVDRPTFTPSIKVTGKQTVMVNGQWTGEWVRGPDGKALDLCCHSFVRAGRIEFLGDCTHTLAGKTVDLPPLPAWPMEE